MKEVYALRTLKQGTTGADVNSLQSTLLKLDYNPGPIDGIFGLKTVQAVKQFQKDNNIHADGIVGPITWQTLQSKIKPALTRSVAGWIPAWQQTQSFQAVQNHPDLFDTLSPFWYMMTVTGDITKFAGAEDSTVLSFAKNQGLNMIPLIYNNFDSELISTVLNDSGLRQKHITNIFNFVRQMNYAGIDIDYENILVIDKAVFVTFLQELKAALAPIGKRLIVTVHAKADAFGDWSGAEAHDYAGIGQAADNVRIMGYDYHWAGDPPGPIAPVDWVDNVLAYAISTISSNKIVLGVPTYGYDWPPGQKATLISYSYAINTANKYNAAIIADVILGPHYNYISNSTVHEVWFTDTSLFDSLLDLVNKYQIFGICMWYPGLEDPKIYDDLRSKFLSKT
jgi:spore germination protein